jgi:hypothetical protein
MQCSVNITASRHPHSQSARFWEQHSKSFQLSSVIRRGLDSKLERGAGVCRLSMMPTAACLTVLLLHLASAANPDPPASIAARCRTGCSVKAVACGSNVSVNAAGRGSGSGAPAVALMGSAEQAWVLQPEAQASLMLREGMFNATTGLCLNVQRMGVDVGDVCWVTLCHPEHPLTANEQWSFNATTATLVNTRSGHCATATADGSVRLGACGGQQRWTYNASSGEIVIEGGASLSSPHCLSVVMPPAPSPPPPPSPALVSVNLTDVVHTVDKRFVSFTLDGSYVSPPPFVCLFVNSDVIVNNASSLPSSLTSLMRVEHTLPMRATRAV